MAGISSRGAGVLENKKKYNGIEWQNDLELNEYDAQFRVLDPQVGKWWQIDPKIDEMYMWSPYASNFDNPILNEDPLGDEPEECCKGFFEAVKIAAVASIAVVTDNILGTDITGQIAKSGAIPTTQVDNWNTAVESGNRASQVLGPIVSGIGSAITAGSITVTEGTAGISIEITGPTALLGVGIGLIGAQLAANSTKNLASENGKIKTSGSYTNTHASNKTYSGKGGEGRAKESADRVAKEYKDPVKKTDWKPSKNNREAFKAEDRRIRRNGGANNSQKNYNKRNSPGKKYNEQDKRKRN